MPKKGDKEEADKEAIGVEKETLEDLAKEAPETLQYLLAFGKYFSEELKLMNELERKADEASLAGFQKGLQHLIEGDKEKSSAEYEMAVTLLTAEGAFHALGTLITYVCPGVFYEQGSRLKEVLERILGYEKRGKTDVVEATQLESQLNDALSRLLEKAIECTLSLRGMEIERDHRTGALKIIYRSKNHVYELET
jgi:hypothetical protein